MDAPFLTGQAVRVIRAAHPFLASEVGRIEIVSQVIGQLVWCQPAVVDAGGAVRPDTRLNFQVARRVSELEAVTCA